jgi:hypothetical protein
VPCLAGVRQRPAQLRGAGGQQGDGLADIALGRGGAYPEPGGQIGECLALAQVGQHQQGLPSRVELAPARAYVLAVTADDSGDVGEGTGRQRQRGRAEKARKPLGGGCGSWSIASSTRGFAMPQADTPPVISRFAEPLRDQD